MTQRMYLDIGGAFPMEEGAPRRAVGPHGLWFYPDQENHPKYERPYSYSPFFVFGDHASIADAECCYSDRYNLWGGEKLKTALKAAGLAGLGCNRVETVPKIARFIQAYHGKQYRLVGVVEWCNVSSGYPCWSFHFKDEGHG